MMFSPIPRGGRAGFSTVPTALAASTSDAGVELARVQSLAFPDTDLEDARVGSAAMVPAREVTGWLPPLSAPVPTVLPDVVWSPPASWPSRGSLRTVR